MVDTWRQSMESQNIIAGDDDQELMALLEPAENIENVWAMEPIGSHSGLDLEINEEFLEQSSRHFAEDTEAENNLMSHRQLSDLMEEPEFNEENYEDIRVIKNYEENNGLDRFNDLYDTNYEEEEELYDRESSSADRENLEEDVPEEVEETELEQDEVDVLADIPAEILRDRRALIEKVRELRKEEPYLRRKNRLYQHWVAKVMSKKNQKMTPEDETLSFTRSEKRYIKELLSYKTSIDEIEARQGEINVVLANLENNLKTVLDEDTETFGEFLNRQREIGVGLICEKSARVLSVKAVEAMIRRQILRRDSLNRDRFHYIFYRHRHEDLKAKLRRVETLGEGMTVMDYEVIRLENYCHKEKLEEREKELEKLYINIQAILNALANYKEKDIANLADIHHEKNRLELFKSKALKTREGVVQVRKNILRIRRACETKKRRGGLLFAFPALHAMEETLTNLKDLKSEVERISPQMKICLEETRPSVRADGSLKVDETRTTVTRMTKVKRSGPSSKKPGRC